VFHNKFFEYEICKITWESFLSPTSDIFFRTLLTSSSVVVISVLGFGTSWVGRKSISYFRTFGFISYGWGITYYITSLIANPYRNGSFIFCFQEIRCFQSIGFETVSKKFLPLLNTQRQHSKNIPIIRGGQVFSIPDTTSSICFHRDRM